MQVGIAQICLKQINQISELHKKLQSLVCKYTINTENNQHKIFTHKYIKKDENYPRKVP